MPLDSDSTSGRANNGIFREQEAPLPSELISRQLNEFAVEDTEPEVENVAPPSKDWLVKFMYSQIAHM